MSTSTPRFLARRFFAMLVDLLLAALVAFALTAPFVAVRGTDALRLGTAPLTITRCVQARTITPEALALLGRIPVSGQYCHQSALGVGNGISAVWLLSGSKIGRVTKSHTATLAVDAAGNPVWPRFPDIPLLPVLVMIGSAWNLARAGASTPGKALFGLRVAGLAGGADALRREGLRWLPFALLSVISTMASLPGIQAASLHASPGQLIATGLIIGLPVVALMIWYYLVPFFSGDRRARWDRAVGAWVERDTKT